jgi:hypothetical protein
MRLKVQNTFKQSTDSIPGGDNYHPARTSGMISSPKMGSQPKFNSKPSSSQMHQMPQNEMSSQNAGFGKDDE